MEIKIYCDGGARGNPGKAACAFVVYGDAGNLRGKCGKYLGIATNNVAEYMAVVWALDWLKKNLGIKIELNKEERKRISFYLDSELLVNQLNGVYKVKKESLRELLFRTRGLEANLGSLFSGVTISYYLISREQNSLADKLVNEVLDQRV